MNRRTYANKMRTLADRATMKYEGRHADGKILAHYRNLHLDFSTGYFSSYAEAWEILKDVRELVGM